MKQKFKSIAITVLVLSISFFSFAQQEKATLSNEELANKLSNPVAKMISVPIQEELDYGKGPLNSVTNTTSIRPVFPFQLTKKFNLINRAIIPLVHQTNVTGVGSNQFGLSDISVNSWFSPISKNTLMWGAGLIMSAPTGSDEYLTTHRWTAGPSAIFFKQDKGFTFGLLVNQFWAFGGDKMYGETSQLYFQPFLSKNFKSGAGISSNVEYTQNWTNDIYTVYLNLGISVATRIDKQAVSLSFGPHIPIAGTTGALNNYGLKGSITLAFPK